VRVRIGSRRRRVALLLFAAAYGPMCLGADFRLFLPRPVDNGAYVELFGSYEKDHLSTDRSMVRWDDLFLKEKLSLYSNGYVYHPRFLEYRLSMSGGLKQESYEASFVSPFGRRNGRSIEYDARVILLPEHPYNLELFALRYEPLMRSQYAAPHDSIGKSRGAEVRYRRKPWFFRARYSDDDIDSEDVFSNVRTLNVGGGYVKEYANGNKLNLDATFIPAQFRTSTGATGRTTSALVEDTLEFGRLRESTSLTMNDQSQNGGGILDTNSRQLLLFEQLRADLGHRLVADLSWRFQDAKSELRGSADSASSAVSSVGNDFQLGLQHKLYDSLQTSYTFHYGSDRSSSGDSTSLANALGLSYSKLIPNGRIIAGLYGGLSDIDSSGRTSVIDETHSGVAVPGTFTLERPTADPRSLLVLVRSPQAPFELILLMENVNYGVETVGNMVQVTILSLPAEFVVPGKYEFRVTYALAGGDFRLRTGTLGHSASVGLFGSLLTPFYTISLVRTAVVAGAAPGGGLDSRAVTAGIAVALGAPRLRIEYMDVYWDTGPYRGWKGDFQYAGNISKTTTANATATYQHRRFSETVTQDAYSETIASVGASVQQFLFARTLSISLGGAYSWVMGLEESRTTSLNASLSWKVGLVDLSGGASYYNSESQNGTIFAGHREHGYCFLKLRRKVF
jgi:hypothetical protein